MVTGWLASALLCGQTWIQMDIRGLLMDLLMDLDHGGLATNVAKPLLLLVGLTRIELVTSSLSGMRSNQLSYSPDSESGTQILLPLTVTLNRPHNHFFFQHGDAYPTHKVGDQVKYSSSQHHHSRGHDHP